MKITIQVDPVNGTYRVWQDMDEGYDPPKLFRGSFKPPMDEKRSLAAGCKEAFKIARKLCC